MIDLSDVFCVDPDEGQKRHDEMDASVWIHFAMMFAFKAGQISDDPGVYKPPVVNDNGRSEQGSKKRTR
jgi:hypothetical protein